MAEKKMTVTVRPKRQITLPREVCERLGLSTGDMLELTLEDRVLLARPKKAVALDALREIREAFKRSGVSEEELQEAGRRIRRQVVEERNAAKA